MHPEGRLNMGKKVMEFFSIKIFDTFYDGATGLMYDKPTPETVLASLHFPRGKPDPKLQVDKWIYLSAYCTGFAGMTDITALVTGTLNLAEAGKYYTILMYRKGKEPDYAHQS